MVPHLYLRRGKKQILLLRSFGQLHFITLDHRADGKTQRWLLEQPRTAEEMKHRGLILESLPLDRIRGVAAAGLGRGHMVQFYRKDCKKRYELRNDCDEETMAALFQGIEAFAAPKQRESWQGDRLASQDPVLRKWLWPAGIAVNVLGIFFGWIAMNGFTLPWANWISLLSLAAALGLYLRFPEYFTIFEDRKPGEKRSAVGLYPVVVLTPIELMAAACGEHHFFGWWKAWLMGGILAVLLAIALWRFVPEFRLPVRAVGFVLAAALLSPGPVLNVDALLDRTPSQVVGREVVDTRTADGKGGPSWYLTVEIDGKEIEFSVSKARYENTQVGDIARVALYDGALGIPHAKLENRK